MVLLIRSNAISKDPRVSKYLSFLYENKIEYKILGWDRNGENLEYKNCKYYRKKSGYNVGGLKAAWDRILWMVFCFREIIKIKPDFIHGCDLDSSFQAAVYKLICNKRVKILFDVFDWYSATLYKQPKAIRAAFKLMESLTTKLSDHIIICEKERSEQIPYEISDKVAILPNIPMITEEDTFRFTDHTLSFPEKKVTISYVGGLYDGRFLDELLIVAEKGLINLLIAGYGDRRIEEKCKSLSKLPNVRYFGGVPYKQGLHISYNSDVIYAMYSKANPNHIYAAPNKYYEAMLLGKPIITTKGTKVGEKVEDNGIGYVIEENIGELEQLVSRLDTIPMDLREKGEKARNLWDNEYATYTSDFLNTTYKNYLITNK